MSDQRPLGLPYHLVYREAEPITDDSRKFRVRYAFLIDHWPEYELWKYVVGATAVENFRPDHHTPSYAKAVHALTFDELLLVMYHVVIYVATREDEGLSMRGAAKEHVKAVQKLLKEERLAWEMDDRGGLHPLRDAAYSMQRQSVIAGLGAPRYANARSIFEKFIDAFDKGQPDNKLAINHVFDTAEALFKLRYAPSPPERLDAGEAGKRLHASFPKSVEQHDPEKYLRRANSEMVDSFVSWVTACQQYRHEKAVADTIDQPPAHITELLVSSGMAYIRWLIRIDPV